MIFLIAAIVVGLIVAIYVGFSDGSFSSALGGFCIGAPIGLILALILTIASVTFPLSVAQTDRYEIHALADNARYSASVSGSVFMTRHTANEKVKYTFLYESDKGCAFKEVNADVCYLNYSNSGGVYVLVNRYDFESNFLRWLMPCVADKVEYVFYLPESAEIIDTYTIDFE